VPAWRFARREGGYHEDRRHATWNAGGTRALLQTRRSVSRRGETPRLKG